MQMVPRWDECMPKKHYRADHYSYTRMQKPSNLDYGAQKRSDRNHMHDK